MHGAAWNVSSELAFGACQEALVCEMAVFAEAGQQVRNGQKLRDEALPPEIKMQMISGPRFAQPSLLP